MTGEQEWLWARWWKSKSFFCLVEGFVLLSFSCLFVEKNKSFFCPLEGFVLFSCLFVCWISKRIFCLVEGFVLLSFVWGHVAISFFHKLKTSFHPLFLCATVWWYSKLFLWITMIIDTKLFQNISQPLLRMTMIFDQDDDSRLGEEGIQATCERSGLLNREVSLRYLIIGKERMD